MSYGEILILDAFSQFIISIWDLLISKGVQFYMVIYIYIYIIIFLFIFYSHTLYYLARKGWENIQAVSILLNVHLA